MEHSGNIPTFIITGALFGNIPRNFVGSIYEILQKYTMEMFHEHSTRIYLPSGKATILKISGYLLTKLDHVINFRRS